MKVGEIVSMTRHQRDVVAAELDRLQHVYKEAVDRWIVAIREEEALATPDHSIVAWEALGAGRLQSTRSPGASDGRERSVQGWAPAPGLAIGARSQIAA
jgi:hypothetical protein